MTPETPSDPPARRIDLGGRPASVAVARGGPAVVAVHGYPGSARDFRWLGAAVEPRCTLVRVEMPGFGGTPLSTAPGRTLGERADYVAEVVEALGLERVVLLGHSMGGAVAVEAVSRLGRRAAGLALLASIGARPHRGWRQAVPPVSSPLLAAPVLGRALRPVLRRAMRGAGFSRAHSDEGMVHAIHCAAAIDWAALRRGLEAVRVPSLVAWAADDPMIEGDIGAEVARLAPEGPRLAFETGGHNIQKSRAVEVGAALVDLAWAVAG